jgi:hypothetical protein
VLIIGFDYLIAVVVVSAAILDRFPDDSGSFYEFAADAFMSW